jgi:hypothetical protein
VAFGLLLLDQLQLQCTSEDDAFEKLDIILEPLLAFDEAAVVVLSAMFVGLPDPNVSAQIKEALLAKFLALQNIDPNNYPAFRSVVRAEIDSSGLLPEKWSII